MNSQLVLSPDCHLLHRLFDVVVVDREAAVGQVVRQRLAVMADAIQGFREFVFRQDSFGHVAIQQLAQASPDRPRVGFSQGLAVGGRQRAAPIFHVI